MQIKKTYIALDGEEFETKSECLDYERNIRNFVKMCRFYSGRIRIPIRGDSYENLVKDLDYAYSNATRIKFDSLNAKNWFKSFFGFSSKYEDHEPLCLSFHIESNSEWVEDEV